MKTTLRNILTTALIIFGAASFVAAYAIPARPEPPRLVNDFAGIFSKRQTEELERMLVAFDDSTSNQITVVTVSSLEGYTASEYATEIGLKWQVGTSKKDNGVVLLVKPKTARESGEVFIAVGYGLEGAIPDAYAKRIVSSYLIPKVKQNDYYSGVYDACIVLMKLASGEISQPREKDGEDSPFLDLIMIAFFIAVIIVVSLMKTGGNGGNGRNGGSGGRRGPDDTFIFFGPTRHSGGGFGGFGGGGSFGGGFGGFGGGSFGGGGSGGKW